MKFGLGESYDTVDVLPKKFRAWLDLTKPASTVGVMFTALAISLFYFLYTDQIALIEDRFSTIVYVVVTVGLVHGASQAMNMAEDAAMDRQTDHKKNRPIPSGIVSEDEARTLAWFLILAALGRAYLVSSSFGIMVSLSVFMGVFYNLEPIRAKARIVSIPWQAVSRGLISFPLVWSAYGDVLNSVPWIFGAFMFFYVLGFQNSADIIDKHVDEKFGIKTFIVMFGVRKTVLIAFAAVWAMMTVLAVAIVFNLLPFRYTGMVFIIPFTLYMVSEMWFNPYAVSDRTGNHPTWLWFYFGMVLCVTIPVVIEMASSNI